MSRTLVSGQPVRANARRLLFIADYGVWGKALYGSQLRSERLAAGLADRFDVTYACMGESPDEAECRSWMTRTGISALVVGKPFDYAHRARWGGPRDVARSLLHRTVPLDIIERATPEFVQCLRERVASTDLVWAHRTWMAEAALRAGFRSIACDISDFEGEMARQTSRTIQSRRKVLFQLLDRRLSRYERSLARRFSRVVLSKEEDRLLVDGGDSIRCQVVPNGFDLPAVVAPSKLTRKVLLFVGALDYAPNIDAILWLHGEIIPAIRTVLPDVELHVAGRGPFPDALRAIRSDPFVSVDVSPETLSTAYAGARVVVTPIRLGHGTRLKVLEALAYGRPLVSTRECLRGHPVVEGIHALVADTTHDFAEACIRLLQDNDLAACLAQRGRALAESLGGWDHPVALATQVLNDI